MSGISDASKPSDKLAWAFDEMRRAKSMAMVLGDSWYLVPLAWFNKWIKHAEAARSGANNATGPGPIDTTPLADPNSPASLRRHLMDEMDYIFVPANVHAVLKEMYGTTGPEFSRKVTTMSTSSASKTIDVYPITYRVYFCKSGVLPTGAPTLVQTHSKYTTIQDVEKAIMKEVDAYLLTGGVSSSVPKRVWVRDSENAATSEAEMLSYPSDAKPEVDKDGAPKPRNLTKHVTDRIGSFWIPLESVEIAAYDYPKGVIDIMIELRDTVSISEDSNEKVSDSKSAVSSRDGLLNLWLKDLHAGDSVDASDSHGKWYEARIVSIAADGSLKVHFKAWSAKFDENITFADIPKRIAPLYSMTPDWRSALKTGDKIDVLVTPPEVSATWEAGTVYAINYRTGQIHVKSRGVAGEEVSKQVSIESELICPHRTHSKPSKADATAAAAPTASTGSSFMSSASSFISKTYDSIKPSGGYSGWGSGGGKSHEPGNPVQPGAVGLRNLGNTCFMNSMLQCLSHAEGLTEVFVSGRYMDQINRTNVLGMGGRVAEEYGSLLQDLWSSKYSAVTPSTFKNTIGKFQPQFAGYQQQDSQEFMLFLLDGLHEDMNRVLKKVPVEKVESHGRPDSIISREAWRRFLLRNDSEIVDRMFGQLRSHVTCRNCGHESVTFDEFNSLPLPIPVKNMRHVSVTVFLQPFGSIPIIIDTAVEATGSVRDLKKAIVNTLQGLKLFPKQTAAGGDMKQLNSTQTPLAGRKRDFGESNLASNANDSDGHTSTPDASISGAAIPDDIYDRLHICVFAMFSKKITATLQDESPIQDALKATYQSILVYELEHATPALDDREYLHVGMRNYNMNYYKHSKQSTSPATDGEAAAEGPKHRFVDLVFVRNRASTQSNAASGGANFYNYTVRAGGAGGYNTLSQHQTLGFPVRTTFELGAVSYAQLYSVIEDFVLAHIPFDSAMKSFSRRNSDNDDASSLNVKAPMRVFLMNHDGTFSDNEYPYLSNDPITAVFQKNSVVILLSDALLSETTSSCSVITSINARLKYLSSVHKMSDVCELEIDSVQGTSTLKPVSGDNDPNYLALLNENAGTKVRANKEIDITMCLDKFVEREAMPEEETWYCPNCKQHKAPFKKFDIWAAPEILIIQLKRFQFIPGSYFVHREKINDQVVFPERGLDLTQYVRGQQGGDSDDVPPPIYDLFAVSEHSGGLGGGHYTAICKTPGTEDWFNYNDSYVSRASSDQLVTPQAYVLFYKRRCPGSFRWAGIQPLKEGELPPEINNSTASTDK